MENLTEDADDFFYNCFYRKKLAANANVFCFFVFWSCVCVCVCGKKVWSKMQMGFLQRENPAENAGGPFGEGKSGGGCR